MPISFSLGIDFVTKVLDNKYCFFSHEIKGKGKQILVDSYEIRLVISHVFVFSNITIICSLALSFDKPTIDCRHNRNMQIDYSLVVFLSIFSIAFSSTSKTLDHTVGDCLSKLATEEITISYNYLQLASKFGTNKAYPGFSSLFTKLSDEYSSKGHELVKFLALRKANLDRLITRDGISIRTTLNSINDVTPGLTEAVDQNDLVYKQVRSCHEKADGVREANVQDYLESHLLDHHIEVTKLLSDIQQRIRDAQPSERQLIMFMIDEELLQTYGDRRKNIFS